MGEAKHPTHSMIILPVPIPFLSVYSVVMLLSRNHRIHGMHGTRGQEPLIQKLWEISDLVDVFEACLREPEKPGAYKNIAMFNPRRVTAIAALIIIAAFVFLALWAFHHAPQ